MHFEKKGSGPAVVLIHGLGAYSFSWRDTAAALSRRFTTYAVDLPGCGKTAAPAGYAYTAEAQATAVAEFIKAQALSNPIIIGHSMGGAVCLYVAKQAGQGGVPNLSKMVLVAPVTTPTSAGGGALAGAMELPAPVLAELVLKQAYGKANTRPVTTAQIAGYAKGLSSRDQKEAFVAYTKNLAKISFSPTELGAIKTKTLLIWGDTDNFVKMEKGENLKALPNASWPPELVKNCGHIPQEQWPAETNRLIEAFLK